MSWIGSGALLFGVNEGGGLVKERLRVSDDQN